MRWRGCSVLLPAFRPQARCRRQTWPCSGSTPPVFATSMWTRCVLSSNGRPRAIPTIWPRSMACGPMSARVWVRPPSTSSSPSTAALPRWCPICWSTRMRACAASMPPMSRPSTARSKDWARQASPARCRSRASLIPIPGSSPPLTAAGTTTSASARPTTATSWASAVWLRCQMPVPRPWLPASRSWLTPWTSLPAPRSTARPNCRNWPTSSPVSCASPRPASPRSRSPRRISSAWGWTRSCSRRPAPRPCWPTSEAAVLTRWTPWPSSPP